MRFILLLLLISVVFPLQAQELDHVLGQVMIRPNEATDIQELQVELQRFAGQPTRFHIKKRLSPQLNIWLAQFDHRHIHERQFLDFLRQHPAIEVAQFNHLVEKREIPNDPLFDDQWHWFNTGQTGGTNDSDVDADLAWDLTTGGTTPLGHDIVVAVVDDGIDLDHPDLVDNLWFNTAEIPNNGIDDDDNGYVDDYNGWNPNSDNDDVDFGSHGVQVSGMIGAKGNNEIGVTGINWDVKIMTIILPNLTEDNVIEAYTYALTHRQKWNETGGEEGAFVVATNSSWGINAGNPDDVPLWCGFYDVLGENGILNCGATANVDWDIDEVGDLPTACPSPYMVSVTATDDNDERTFSAFGVIHVDVGAPGDNVFTTSGGGGYGFTSGTSFASPLTAGIIALMYSAPCSDLAGQALSDPQFAADRVLDYLYAGVDQVPNLDGEVATGGRVNAFNSIQLLLESCGPCPEPAALTAEELTLNSASLDWFVSDSATSVTLRWREVDAPDWIVIPDASAPLQLNDLESCQLYEFQVQAICTDTTTNFTESFLFTTDGCCDTPSNLQYLDNSTVSWDPVTAAESYEARYREVSTTDWTMLTIGGADNMVTLDDLLECTAYEFQIRTICTGEISEYSPLLTFTTSCGACVDLEYCETLDPFADFNWIESVSLNTINNISGNDNGYGDYTSVSTNIELGQTYSLQVIQDQEFAFESVYLAWIDFDQSGTFEDDELVMNSGDTPIFDLNFATNVTIFPDALPGFTRMRVMLSAFVTSGPCQDFITGEVEDYCLEITEGNGCYAPFDIEVSNFTENEVTVDWTDESGSSYNIRYRPVGSGTWENFDNIINNSFVITGLQPCTDYEFQIQTNCDGGLTSPYSFLGTFRTFGCGSCLDFDYCASQGENTDFEFINRVTIEDIDNISGDDFGYGDFTEAFTTELAPDSTYEIYMEPIYPYGTFDVTFSVFIDFDQDGEFDPLTELAYLSPTVLGPVTGSITVPIDAVTGSTRMRVSMEEFGQADPCETFFFGEVEDYCVDIVPSILPCTPPMNVMMTDSTSSTASFSWDPDQWGLGIGYIFRYRELGTIDWTELSDNDNTATVTGLENCTAYEFQVRTICPAELSPFSEMLDFQTACLNATYDPEGVDLLDVFPNPFSDQINVQFHLKTASTVDMQLLSATGQVLQAETLTQMQAGDQSYTFYQTSDLPAGVYLLRITTERGSTTAKLIKSL